MRRPTFCIVGAPKCATTTVAHYLARRPDVFLTPVKEPHHFNTDGGYVGISSRKRYEGLYEGASDAHRAVGEASVGYLSSEVALANLIAYSPDIRLVACVRNPLQMLPSLHQQYVFNGEEPLEDFEAAWRASESRKASGFTASSGHDWRVFDYPRMGRLGEQVARMFEVAGRERCHVVVLDDLKADPQAVLRGVLEHIGASTEAIGEVPPVNRAKRARVPALRHLMIGVASAKRALGVTRSFGIASRLVALNGIEERWTPLSPSLRAELTATFRDDVALLSELLDRDLTPWLTPALPSEAAHEGPQPARYGGSSR